MNKEQYIIHTIDMCKANDVILNVESLRSFIDSIPHMDMGMFHIGIRKDGEIDGGWVNGSLDQPTGLVFTPSGQMSSREFSILRLGKDVYN